MLPKPALKYLLAALEGTPFVLKTLTASYTVDSEVWDIRPDPDRFSLREVAAHLADWDGIFHTRIHRILHEEHPALEDLDEGLIAIERKYAESDPIASLLRFQKERQKLIAMLTALTEEQWGRTGFKEMVGDLSVEQMAVLILGHDGYHAEQFARYLSLD